jgi:ABC-type arginine transport system permease subunit
MVLGVVAGVVALGVLISAFAADIMRTLVDMHSG